jgi:quinol monooxygenase YgiN
MSIVVVATAYPVPEHRDEVITAFENAIALVHAHDAGCELYALHEGPDRLVMVEKWESRQALAEHGRGPALAELGQAMAGKLAQDLDVQILTPHPAGTARQGTL